MLHRISWLMVFTLLAAFLFPGTVVAHKVNVFAYVEGGIIYAESYFPDGRPVESGKVLVYDSTEQLLLEGKTDAQGMVQFAVPKQDDLTLVIDAGMGHKNKFLLKKSATKE